MIELLFLDVSIHTSSNELWNTSNKVVWIVQKRKREKKKMPAVKVLRRAGSHSSMQSLIAASNQQKLELSSRYTSRRCCLLRRFFPYLHSIQFSSLQVAFLISQGLRHSFIPLVLFVPSYNGLCSLVQILSVRKRDPSDSSVSTMWNTESALERVK